MGKFAYVFAITLVALLVFGCVSQPPAAPSPPPSSPPSPPQLVGNDTDSHGCKGSAGYTWCESKQKCLRSWEEGCPAASPMLDGNDADKYGCIGSAGYSWCAEKGKCLRAWEETCNATDRFTNAQERCADQNAEQISVCGQYIKVVSKLIGGGSTFYADNGTEIRCPLVAPDSMSDQCKLLMMGNNCVEQIVNCTAANVPRAVKDLKDDPSFVGAQLTWSQPDSNAVDYEIFRADETLKSVSLIKITAQTKYDDVFDGGNKTFMYFVRARNANGAESLNSNLIYVQQLITANHPSPGQID